SRLRSLSAFHKTENAARAISTESPSRFLTLVHLHKADFNLALGRVRRSRARKWSQKDIDDKWGWQNRIDDAAELRSFWNLDADSEKPLAPGRLTPIAQGIKQALI